MFRVGSDLWRRLATVPRCSHELATLRAACGGQRGRPYTIAAAAIPCGSRSSGWRVGVVGGSAAAAVSAALATLGLQDPVECAVDDVFEVPKSLVYSAVVAGAGYAAVRYVMPTLLDPAKKHKEIQKNYASLMTVAEKLERAVDSTRAVLGEPPISAMQFFRAIALYHSTISARIADDPMFMVRVVDKATGGTEVDDDMLADLLMLFPLAVAAYDDTSSVEEVVNKSKLILLYHDTITAAAERTSHFACYDPDHKRVFISVKGTDSLDDLVTDVCLAPMPLQHVVGSRSVADNNTVAHDAIATSARHLANRLGPLLKLVEASHPDFEVTVTGHSLGAGTACLLAILLKEDVGVSNVRAVGFATPPVIDLEAAIKAKDYVTSVVNHTDVIPRVSVRNALVFGEVLAAIATVQEDLGDEEAATRIEKITKTALDATPRRHDDLHVPGKVVHMVRDGNGGVHARVGDGTSSPLSVIVPGISLLTDHTWIQYNESLQALGKPRLPNAAESARVL